METKHKVKQLAEKLATSNTEYNQLQKARFVHKAQTELGNNDYYSTYKALYIFCLLAALVAQVASLVSEHGYFAALLSQNLSPVLCMAAAAVLVLGLELAKYVVVGKALQGAFAFNRRHNFGLYAVALGLSALSVYASLEGGGQLAIDKEAVSMAGIEYADEAAQLRTEIADIKKRNTWKNSTYIVGSEKKLLHAKEAQLAKALAAKEAARQTEASAQQQLATEYRYGFAAFELVFLLATLYGYVYKRRVALEELAQDAATNTAPTPQPPAYQQHTQAHTAQPFERPNANGSRPIGFVYGQNITKQEAQDGNNENRNNENRKDENRSEVRITEGTRICKHCGQAYTHRHHKQLYCSDQCRIAFWETEHKRPIKKRKKQLDLF